MTKRISTAGSAVLAFLIAAAAPAAAQMPVFDTANYSQNLLQAARALEQINNQVKALQNQASMLETMNRNLKTIDFPQLQQIRSSLQKIDNLMNQAQAVSFRADRVDATSRAMFPSDVSSNSTLDERSAKAKERYDAAMAAVRHSMGVQAEIVSNLQADAAVLGDLAGRSQGSEGALQAQQAANQILALSAKQQMQLQSLLAAEFRSQAIERATRAQAEAESRAAASRFLGSGKAYSSTRE